MNIEPVKLWRSVQAADKRFTPFRKTRQLFINQLVGPYYNQESGSNKIDKVPLSLIYSICQTLMPNLILDPSTMVDTQDAMKLPFAKAFGFAIDDALNQADFGDTLERAIFDSLFFMGITYCGRGESVDGSVDAFIDVVDLDDYVCDPYATSRKLYQFEGHRIRVGYDWAMEQTGFKFNKKVLSALNPNDRAHNDRLAAETANPNFQRREDILIPEIELWSIYLPSERKIVYLPVGLQVDDFVGEVPWDGPASGPYDVLNMMDVPSNSIGLGIMPAIFDLHLARNTVARKMLRQAEREKNLIVTDKSNPEDADTIKKASDGDVIETAGGKERVGQVNLSGADKSGYDVSKWMADEMNKIAGNLDAIGGTEKGSNTLGQDSLLYSSATNKLGMWRKRIIKFTTSIMRKVGWFVWDDTDTHNTYNEQIGHNIKITHHWTDERIGEYTDYRIECRGHNINNATPEESYSRLKQFTTEVVLPAAQIGQMQGTVLNVAELVKLTGEYLDIEHLDDLFKSPTPQQQQAMQNNQQPPNVGKEGEEPINRDGRQSALPEHTPNKAATPIEQRNEMINQ